MDRPPQAPDGGGGEGEEADMGGEEDAETMLEYAIVRG